MFQSGTVFQFGPFETGLHTRRENQAIENTRVNGVASRQKACTGIAGQSACGARVCFGRGLCPKRCMAGWGACDFLVVLSGSGYLAVRKG